MKKSLYGQYIAEREGNIILETEFGFATCQIEENSIYLMDMYVVPEKRQTGVGRDFLNKAAELAKEHNKSIITTSVCYNTNNPETSMLAILSCGFKFFNVKESDNMIYFYKEI